MAKLTRWIASTVIVLIVIPNPARADASTKYKDHWLVHVRDATSDQLHAIETLGAVVLNCAPAPGDIDVVASEQQLDAIRAMGVAFDLQHENVQSLIDAERQPSPLRGGDPYEDYFLDYHEYDNGTGSIVWFMNELVTRYPNLVSMIDIGTSGEGRTIWGLRLANDAIGGNKPGALYFSCVHAREWVTTTAPTYFAQHILENYGIDPIITDMVNKTEIFLVPVSNPDGFAFTWSDDRLWRKTRTINSNGTIGVDINRNWGEAWGFDDDGSSPSPSSAVYRGPTPFSEPETVALRDFMLNHPNMRTMVDIHSFTQLILWPWGYIPDLCPDNDLFSEHGLAMQDIILGVHGLNYTAGPTYTTIYPVNGDSLDWAYAQLGMLAFSFEMRPESGPFGSGFILDPEEIIPNNEEITPALLYLTNTDFVRSPVIIDLETEIPEVLSPGVNLPLQLTVTSQYEDYTAGTARMYYRFDTNGPFNEVMLTQVSSNGYETTLPATNCSSTPEFYFAADSNQGSISTLPSSADLGPYNPPVAVGPFYSEEFDTDPGWATEGDWAWGVPTGGGTFNGDPTSGYTGSNVYGYNLAGNYANNLPPTYLTTTSIDCTGQFGVELRFWRWLGVESAFGFDDATISVSNDGTSWTELYSAAADHIGDNGFETDTEWTHQSFDISAVADNQSTVFLRWGMGPTDGSNSLPGWNIDDVVLFAKGCVATKGDYNGDSAVDDGDAIAFPGCLQGPADSTPPGCSILDFDDNNHVDLTDFAQFQSAAQ
ncbi:MAG: hypothetical protein DHS20C16_12950 [Phycisphaerae bacterium]|nr:MAG: hypothetical protein DHS20C16_12950 [Phycisphaerae bacterium]